MAKRYTADGWHESRATKEHLVTQECFNRHGVVTVTVRPYGSSCDSKAVSCRFYDKAEANRAFRGSVRRFIREHCDDREG